MQYHQSTGPYAYLSENYCCKVPYDGEKWPSAQHAFQAAKICRKAHGEDTAKLRQQILNANLKEAVRIGRKVIKMDDDFKDRGHAIEIMFRIILSKFRHNRHLAHRLIYDTTVENPGGPRTEKPIWHVAEGFWGTAAEARAQPGGSRSGSAQRWYSGDNWNGKILAVVRKLLMSEIRLQPQVPRHTGHFLRMSGAR